MNKLVLFDIDGTLISVCNAHLKSFSEAFKKVYGIDADIEVINYHGMTEQQIIIGVLEKKGLSEQEIKSKIKECLEAMADSFNRFIKDEKIVLLEGVQQLLEELDKNNFKMGLVTGGSEDIARGKLKKAGINHYFKVGGFGNDDIDKADLVKLAVKRAQEKFNFNFDNIFLFGDAPQDMKAGKEAGVKTIGATAGIYSEKELKGAGADFIVESLKDKDRILKEIIKI